MKYLSLCSGIEAATVAWHPLGWEAVAYSEIERFPSEVLAHHYPNTPNLGDMTKFKEWSIEPNVDLLVGGTPCQSFSVAGLRKGLDDPRGNLMLTYLAIADKYRPKWLVWENVPGVLSSNGGHDFASFLRGLGELGYGFAYRVLDAQYFGVAQRRRRVFVVGYLGDWQRAAAVLFERDSLCGNPAPSRQKREGVASYTPSGFRGYSQESGTLRANGGDLGGGSENLLVDKQWPADISSSLDTTFGTKMGLENQHVNAGCPMFVPAEVTTVQTFRARRPGEGGMSHDHEHIVPVLSPALNTQSGANHAPDTKAYVVQPIAYNIAPGKGALKDDIHVTTADATKTLDASGSNPAMHQGGAAILQPIAYNITFCDANGTRADRPNGGLYVSETDVSSTMTKAGIGTNVAQPMVVHGTQDPCVSDIAFAQGRNNGGENVMVQAVGTDLYNGNITGDVAATMGTPGSSSNASGPTVMQSMAVRRLTPVECERLQGFPDTYTDIKSKGKATPDGPRYKALGNSMAVPVMAWIGKRINEVEELCKPNK